MANPTTNLKMDANIPHCHQLSLERLDRRLKHRFRLQVYYGASTCLSVLLNAEKPQQEFSLVETTVISFGIVNKNINRNRKRTALLFAFNLRDQIFEQNIQRKSSTDLQLLTVFERPVQKVDMSTPSRVVVEKVIGNLIRRRTSDELALKIFKDNDPFLAVKLLRSQLESIN